MANFALKRKPSWKHKANTPNFTKKYFSTKKNQFSLKNYCFKFFMNFHEIFFGKFFQSLFVRPFL